MHFRLTARDEFTPDGPADHPGGLSSADVTVTVDSVRRSVPGHLAGHGGLARLRRRERHLGRRRHGTRRVGAQREDQPVDRRRTDLPDGPGRPSTPNDGAQIVTLPNITTSTARIKVEAVDNYFFDINDANFSIQPAGPNTAPVVNAGPDGTVAVGAPFTSSGSFTDDDLATCDRDGRLRRRSAARRPSP